MGGGTEGAGEETGDAGATELGWTLEIPPWSWLCVEL